MLNFKGLIAALALACLALPGAALAQGCGSQNPNCIVPTAPNGTSTNQAASTAFVQNAFAGGSSLSLANGTFFIGGLDGLAHAQSMAGDCASTNAGVITCTKTNGISFGTFATGTDAANLTGTVSVNRFNSGAGASTSTFLRGDGTWQTATSINAAQFGIKCDGVTDDGPAFTTAFNALAGAPLVLPAGICRIATTAYRNTFIGPGILTVPGVKIIGQGRGVTTIDTAVANGYAIAVNPAWSALHKSMFSLTAGTSGALATNTYFVQTTVTDNLGNEINVSPAKSVSVTGPTGSISITLQPINTGYSYNIYIGTSSTPANYATVSGGDAIHLGGNQAVVISATGSAHAVPTANRAVWQEALIANLSITNSTGAANASGVLWFRVGYSLWSNVYAQGLTGDGLAIPNWTGDNDGSFVVTVDSSKFDTIAGTCLNTAGNTLEFSNLTVSNSVFNICGTGPAGLNTPITMTAITNANPGVVTTASAHNLQSNDQVYVSGVAGMSLAAGMYRACGTVSASTFSLCDLNRGNINTTSLGAYTASSGTESLRWRPPVMQANGNGPSQSGAIAWTGLIGTFFNNGFTQNNNYNFYFTEAGANDNATLWANDMENTAGKGLYAASIINFSWTNGECLTAAALGQTLSCMQFGTGFNLGTANNVTINGIKVRSDSAIANGFEQLNGAGGLFYQNTYSVYNVAWQTWSGLNKYVGFQGNPRPFFWARFDGLTGSACTLKDSFNIASCVRNGVGDYTLTFTTASLDASYSISGTGMKTGTAPGVLSITNIPNITTSSVRFSCLNTTSAAAIDCDVASIQGFGNPF